MLKLCHLTAAFIKCLNNAMIRNFKASQAYIHFPEDTYYWLWASHLAFVTVGFHIHHNSSRTAKYNFMSLGNYKKEPNHKQNL